MWMLPICIATLPPASWLAVEAPPPSVLLLLLLLLLSPLFLLRTSSGTALPMLPVCECVCSCPGAALSGTAVAIARSHWEQRSLDGERVRYLAQLTGAITPSFCAPLQLSDTCKWDSDLTMVPFLWTSFETTGGGKGGKLRMSVLVFWRDSLCKGAIILFPSWLFCILPVFFLLFGILPVFGEEDVFNFVRLNIRRKREIEIIGELWELEQAGISPLLFEVALISWVNVFDCFSMMIYDTSLPPWVLLRIS